MWALSIPGLSCWVGHGCRPWILFTGAISQGCIWGMIISLPQEQPRWPLTINVVDSTAHCSSVKSETYCIPFSVQLGPPPSPLCSLECIENMSFSCCQHPWNTEGLICSLAGRVKSQVLYRTCLFWWQRWDADRDTAFWKRKDKNPLGRLWDVRRLCHLVGLLSPRW